MLAAVMVVVAEVKTVERNLRPWNEESSCVEIHE